MALQGGGGAFGCLQAGIERGLYLEEGASNMMHTLSGGYLNITLESQCKKSNNKIGIKRVVAKT